MHQNDKRQLRRMLVGLGVTGLVLALPSEVAAQMSDQPIRELMEHVHEVTAGWVGPLSEYGKGIFMVLFGTEFTFRCLELASAGKGVEGITHFLTMRIIYFVFWFGLLSEAEWLTRAIPASVLALEAAAGGTGTAMRPQGIMAYGIEIVTMTLSDVVDAGLTNMVAALSMYFTSLLLLMGFFALAVMYAIAEIKVWFIAAAGVFVLGFAGSTWTRHLAEGYLKSLLAASVKFMVIGLIVRAAGGLIGEIRTQALAAGTLGDNLEVFMGAVVTLGFVVVMAKAVPDAIGAIITGGSAGGSSLNIMALPTGAARAIGGAGSAGARSRPGQAASSLGGRAAGAAAILGAGAVAGTGAWAASKAKAAGSAVAGAVNTMRGGGGGASGGGPVSGGGGAAPAPGGASSTTGKSAQANRDASVLPPVGGAAGGAGGKPQGAPVSGQGGGGGSTSAASPTPAKGAGGGFGTGDKGWPASSEPSGGQTNAESAPTSGESGNQDGGAPPAEPTDAGDSDEQ